MTDQKPDSSTLVIQGLREIIQPARELARLYCPSAIKLGEGWESTCPGAMAAFLPLGEMEPTFIELSPLPPDEDWQGYLRGKLLAVGQSGVVTSMSVRNAAAEVYGGGLSEALLSRAYEAGLIDHTLGDIALTGGDETWDQGTLVTGVFRALGPSTALFNVLDWDAAGVAACAQEEGHSRATYETLVSEMAQLALAA